jgi:hypothetical protein
VEIRKIEKKAADEPTKGQKLAVRESDDKNYFFLRVPRPILHLQTKI